MKKIFALILALAMTVCLFIPSLANGKNGKFGEVPKMDDNSVVVDGIMDSLYSHAVKIGINRCPADYTEKYLPTEGDTFGTAYIVYDSKYLYIYLDITDSTPYTLPEGAKPWDDDCVEVHIDWTNSGESSAVQHRISSTGAVSRDEKTEGLEFSGASVKKDNGWYGELKIPLESSTEGLSIGLGIMISNFNGQSGHQELALENNSTNQGTCGVSEHFDYITLGAMARIPDVAQCTVSAIDPQIYTGEKIEPEFEVIGAIGEKLVAGTDYYFEYIKNVDVGLGYIAISGKGSYNGVKFVSFKIVCPHDETTAVTAVNPTFTENGLKNICCAKCGKVISSEVISKVDNGFLDVKNTAWYANAVCYAFTNGLMNGVSNTSFAPDKTTTRAMLVQVLYNIEGKPETDDSSFPLNDVKVGAWYRKAVVWAYTNKIVSGTGSTTFSPDATITREQLATILYNYAKFKGNDVSAEASLDEYPDNGDVSSYALSALKWATENKIISGSDGKLLPKNGATRAEMASMLMRFLK